MDAKQFQQMMEVVAATFARNQEQIGSHVTAFEQFESKKEKFTCYLDRFENYLAINNVTEDTKKSQLLCASIGPVHNNNLSDF